MELDDFFVKLLAYGPYGIGKTHLLKTGAGDPRIFPMLLLNFEAGTMSVQSVINKLQPIRDFYKKCKDEAKPKRAYITEYQEYLNDDTKNASLSKIDVLRVESWDDLEDVLDILESGTKYRSLGVDSLTEINYLVLREVTEMAGKMNPAKHDGELSQLQDYGRASTRMRRVIRSFRDLEMNVFLTALPVENKDDTTGAVEIRPSLVGKLSEEIPGMLDIVGYMTVPRLKPNSTGDEEPRRTIHFQPTNKFRAKDRSEGGKLGNNIEVDKDTRTLPMIFDLLEIHPTSTEQATIKK